MQPLTLQRWFGFYALNRHQKEKEAPARRGQVPAEEPGSGIARRRSIRKYRETWRRQIASVQSPRRRSATRCGCHPLDSRQLVVVNPLKPMRRASSLTFLSKVVVPYNKSRSARRATPGASTISNGGCPVTCPPCSSEHSGWPGHNSALCPEGALNAVARCELAASKKRQRRSAPIFFPPGDDP